MTMMIEKQSKNIQIYGSMYANNISQAVTVSAVDTYYEIGGGLTGGTCQGMTFQNSKELKVAKAGKYKIDYAISAYTAVALNQIETTCMINGTAQTNVTSHIEQVSTNAPNTTAGHGVLTLAVNDTVSLAVSNHTATTNITVEHVSCTLTYLGDGPAVIGTNVMYTPLLAKQHTASSVTGTLTETTLFSTTIPGGAISANGTLEVTFMMTFTSSVNNKTINVKLGSTTIWSTTQTTNTGFQTKVLLYNRNSESSQVRFVSVANLFNTTALFVPSTFTINTSTDQTLSITGTLANTGETITLEAVDVQINK